MMGGGQDHVGDVDVPIETEDAFWDELDDIVSTPCRSHDRIDDTLRTWLALTTGEKYREDFIQTEEDVVRCAIKLLESELYEKHTEYVRRQLAYAFLQEDDPATLHVITTFLLFDGMRDDSTFEMMMAEGAFLRLVELIGGGTDDGLGLHRRLLELLYEMSRIQRLGWDDLNAIGDDFILYLFKIIEELAHDVNDPYHYPVIRVLLVLNEQYMVFAHDPSTTESNRAPITNRVIKTLSLHGVAYKTFGENIILLLNRESETALQLLILKVLYLLFTTPSTREYFYTNDLHVLVDILIRNLLDLPSDFHRITTPNGGTGSFPRASSTRSLRHTYLRVLHPLLAHTQLRYPPHYKREQLRNTLFILADASHNHFDRPDDTTMRLVGRCVSLEWLRDVEDEAAGQEPGTPLDNIATNTDETMMSPTITLDPASRPGTPGRGAMTAIGASNGRETTASARAGQAAVAKRLLGMGLPEAQESNVSVAEIAVQTEKPGVITPSRNAIKGALNESSPTEEDSPNDKKHEHGKIRIRGVKKALPLRPKRKEDVKDGDGRTGNGGIKTEAEANPFDDG